MRPAVILILGLLTSALTMSAQSGRPVTAAWTVEGGSAHLADTYLTPLKYDGWNIGIGYERWQAMRFNPEKWVMRLYLNAQIADTHNPAHNTNMWDLRGNGSWSMMRRWQIPLWGERFTVAVGPVAKLDVGCLYLMRNGNNPVSARAAFMVGATGAFLWHTNLAKRPLTLRWQPSLPLAGAFFSPDYGELYYEIYLGDKSGLAHFAWPVSRFEIENLVTADWRLGATAVRLGYRGEVITTSVNNLTTRRFTHSLILGISGEFLSLSPGKKVSENNISAYY